VQGAHALLVGLPEGRSAGVEFRLESWMIQAPASHADPVDAKTAGDLLVRLAADEQVDGVQLRDSEFV